MPLRGSRKRAFAARYALLVASLIATAVVAAFVWDGGGAKSHAVVSQPKRPMPPLAAEGQRWISNSATLIRMEARRTANLMARVPSDEPFVAYGSTNDSDCPPHGWLQTDGGGFACAPDARKTEEAPVRLPRLVRFVHPDPREWDTYVETMKYDTSPADKVNAMVPFIYAKRWGQWTGSHYRSLAAYRDGEEASRKLGKGRKYHFIDAHSTTRGTVLERANGAVVPAHDVHVYPLTKFHGWNLETDPIQNGFIPAWAVDYEGTPVHTAPDDTAPIAMRLAYHTAIAVEDEPVDRSGHWWVMPNGLGPGKPGYVNDHSGIRHLSAASPPADVGPSDLWIDVDVEQQVLALRRGSDVQFATLVSTGAPGTSTPRGLYAIQDKSAWGDMASRPDSDDPYYVEKVPWVMHFKKRYALHGTFWHWGFGHTASHGCINLSVRDARWIYDRISPSAYGGWHTVQATKRSPGTLLRVRRGTGPVPDRRGG